MKIELQGKDLWFPIETSIKDHSEEYPAGFSADSSKYDQLSDGSGTSYYFLNSKKREWNQASAKAIARICKKIKTVYHDMQDDLNAPLFWARLHDHYKEPDKLVANRCLTKLITFTLDSKSKIRVKRYMARQLHEEEKGKESKRKIKSRVASSLDKKKVSFAKSSTHKPSSKECAGVGSSGSDSDNHILGDTLNRSGKGSEKLKGHGLLAHYDSSSSDKVSFATDEPATSHQNGPAERNIQTAEADARALLKNTNLPVEFWDEALEYDDAITRNCTAVGPLIDDEITSPIGAYIGQKPSINNIKVFGSRCYAHIKEDTIPPGQRTV
ncbi:hypothetical protein BJ878DRAFT_566033 [Calycina marina]|uniref:Uncharacterized protein n=1 Tax=Calycina marina TaxID=1763456 RepID=A0A9P8CI65_9HELO|nr:hypothetical protein BJ878DRAFT_566033 [Calycina marina]